MLLAVTPMTQRIHIMNNKAPAFHFRNAFRLQLLQQPVAFMSGCTDYISKMIMAHRYSDAELALRLLSIMLRQLK
ncbi:hypothetical protein D3C80_2094010 [compost metagenome]